MFLLSMLIGCQQEESGSVATSRDVSKNAASIPDTVHSEKSAVFSDLSTKASGPSKPSKRLSPVMFSDVAGQVGIDFEYQNGASGKRLMVEATGGGVGWLDYDRDGFWDIYFPQGGTPGASSTQSQPIDQVYRNIDGNKLQQITELSGVNEHEYSQGVAVGDFDNDGFDDVFVTNIGRNTLLHNRGDGTFDDITDLRDFPQLLWSSSAAWGDIDRDGDLDLYVCNYVDYDPFHPRICHNSKGQPAMCHPQQVEAVPDEFYINEGDGRFSASASRLGLYGPGNKALGVVIADLNNDDWPDIYVANDTTANFLFLNRHGQQFEEQAITLGCAVSGEGQPQASMGVGIGDVDRNGFLDLYCTHFVHEWNTLYLNLGAQGFHDRTAQYGLVAPTLRYLAFGTALSDLNGDGLLDIVVANGHIDDYRFEGVEYEMQPQVFLNGGGRFVDVSKSAGAYFRQKRIGRGLAISDYNKDGRLDVLIGNQNMPPALLRNESEPLKWLAIDLIGCKSPRRGIGARVSISRGDDTAFVELVGGGSYASSHESSVYFGLGDDCRVLDVTIQWPSGIVQVLSGVECDQRLSVIEQ